MTSAHRPETLRATAARGARWNIAAYGTTKAIGFSTTLVLARLLTPEEFGLVVLAQALALGFNVLSSFGMHNVVISRPRGSERDEGVLLFVLLACSMMGALLLAVSAPVLGWVFDESQLPMMLVVLSSTILITGGTWYYDGILQRELDFRPRFIAQTVQVVVHATVALGLAVAGVGVWSIIVGLVVSSLASMLTVYRLAHSHVRPVADRTVGRRLLAQGRGFFAQTIAHFVQSNADYLVVGSRLGTTDLGYYNLAFRIAEVPNAAVADPVGRATFPVFARLAREGRAAATQFDAVLTIVCLVTLPAGVLLAASADATVALLLGDDWAGAANVLAVLGLWVPLRSAETAFTWFLNGYGLSHLIGTIGLATLPVLLVGLVAGTEVWGVVGAGGALVVHSLVGLSALVWANRRRVAGGSRVGRGVLRMLVPAALAVVAVRVTLGAVDTNAVGEALSAWIAGLVVYGLALVVVARSTVTASLSDLRRAMGRDVPV